MTKPVHLLLALVAFAALSHQQQSFDDWVAHCGWTYESDDDRAYRERVFNENVARNEEVNSQNLGYTLGPNCLTGDRTDQEKQNMVPKVTPPSASSPGPVRLRAEVGLPNSVDWRDEGCVSAVKNQGSCGSCWSFSTVGVYQSFVMIAGMGEYDLSQEFILECTNVLGTASPASSCAGGIMDHALPVAVDYGLPTQSEFPYTASSYGSNAGFPNTAGICDVSDTSSFIKENIDGEYFTYRDLSHEEMKDLIAYAPVVGLIYADSGFMNLNSGVYSGCPDYETSKAAINHAVVIVGYDEDGNYIVKNSWDTTWGVDGFGTVSKDADCALAAYVYEIRGTNEQLTSEPISAKIFLGALLIILMIVG